jgi:hypothetical protein
MARTPWKPPFRWTNKTFPLVEQNTWFHASPSGDPLKDGHARRCTAGVTQMPTSESSRGSTTRNRPRNPGSKSQNCECRDTGGLLVLCNFEIETYPGPAPRPQSERCANGSMIGLAFAIDRLARVLLPHGYYCRSSQGEDLFLTANEPDYCDCRAVVSLESLHAWEAEQTREIQLKISMWPGAATNMKRHCMSFD